MTTETNPVVRTPRGRPFSFALLLLVGAGGIYVGMRWHTTFERWLVPTGAGMTTPADGPPAAERQLWTCGMHPQVIQDHPGDCPICHMKLTPLLNAGAEGTSAPSPDSPGASAQDRKIKYWWDPMMDPPYISSEPGKSPMGMDLVPVYEDEAQPAGAAVVIDPAIVQNMGIRTAEVTEGPLDETLRVTALITEPEPGHRDINLRVSGWIQTLYANTDGMEVKQGDPLFDLYSPELRLAIEELIAARGAVGAADAEAGTALRETSASLAAAAEGRLLTLGLTPEQIAEFGALEHAPAVVTFLSPIDGHITEKMGVYAGAAVMAGEQVFRLAQRTTMWVEARVPEGSLGRVRVGQKASARVDAYPGRAFEGEVIFIHPHLDMMTRTALVRLALPNHDYALHEGMYATVEIGLGDAERATLAPREAVIDTGESQVVFVSAGGGRFEPRRVVMGRSARDGLVQILSGLEPGETVVASGQFLLDSESRLREAIAKFLGQGQADTPRPAPAAPPVPPAATPEATPTPPVGLSPAGIDAVVAAYLPLAESLGATQTDDTPLKLDALVASIHTLHAEATTPDALRLVTSAVGAAGAMSGQPLDRQRDLFKPLSASVIALVDAAPPSPSVAESLSIVNCPMAEADWIQRTREVANPYYADNMKRCSSVVRSVGAKGAG